MSERKSYPPGAPCWVDTIQSDPETATRFYAAIFGWRFIGPGTGKYFVAQLRGRDVAAVGWQPRKGASPAPVWNTYIAVENVEDAAEKVKSAGGGIVVPPFDALPAGRMAALRDPAGAVFCAWEAKDRQGAQLVNEPSAWAMSSLITRDPEGSKAFYRTVFGWKTETFGGGGAPITLCRLPEYVGGESKQPVPRDVVAVMIPKSGDAFPEQVRPHWNVDFWVADIDAVAAQAAQLGGKVVVPPHETPGFKTATIADPQGALFSVSQLLARP